MNPMQFFMGQTLPFRLKKKIARLTWAKAKKPLVQGSSTNESQEQDMENQRLASYDLDRYAKHLINGHRF